MRGGGRFMAAGSLAAALALGASIALAAPGDPDAAFGTDGVVITDLGGTAERAAGVVHQSDGSIVVLADDDNTRDTVLIRYRSDGSLDTSFGTGGVVDVPRVGDFVLPGDLLVTDDDSLILVGSTFVATEYDLIVMKFTSDGVPDTAFGGGDGHVEADLGHWDFGVSGALDGAGRIVIAGRTRPDSATAYDGLVARFTASGVLDTSFSGDGWATLGSTAFDEFTDVAVDSSNRPVVTGYTSLDGAGLVVARLTASGSLDGTFGAGYVIPALPVAGEGLAIDIDQSERIVVGGRVGTDTDILVLRLSSTGSLDSTFGGGDGHLIEDFSGYVYDAIADLAVADDGSIVAVGLAGDGGLVARFTDVGTFDTTFSGDGFDITDVTTSSESLQALSLDDAGRVVAVGNFQDADTGDNDLLMVRYLLEDPPPATTTTTTTVPDTVDSFDDDNGSVHEADIEALAASGITRGCGERLFCPRDSVTRDQMAAFLQRAVPLPYPAGDPDSFSDDDGSVFESDIEALAASGVTRGCAEELFCPSAPVTRGQMAAFLVRALGLERPAGDPDTFADDNGSVFESDIEALAASGITRGCGPQSFCPDDPVTREQMASFLVRAFVTP
jgi:uncharacterized delta-60 repeat protein